MLTEPKPSFVSKPIMNMFRPINRVVAALVLAGAFASATVAIIYLKPLAQAQVVPQPIPLLKGEPRTEPPSQSQSDLIPQAPSRLDPEKAFFRQELPRQENANEPDPRDIPGKKNIHIPGRSDLVLVPAEPSKPNAEWRKWCYFPDFEIVKAEYVPVSRLLVVQLTAALSPETETRVKTILQTDIGAIDQTGIGLSMIRIENMVECFVEGIDGKQFYLKSDPANPTKKAFLVGNGPSSFIYKVADDQLHDLLSNRLEDVTLLVRSMHPYTDVVRGKIDMVKLTRVARNSFDKVIPHVPPNAPPHEGTLYIDRDSETALKGKLSEELALTLSGDISMIPDAPAVIKEFMNRLTATPISLPDATDDMIDRCLVWDSKTVKLDTATSIRKKYTQTLTTSQERKKAARTAWTLMREQRDKLGSAEDWHNAIHEKVKVDGGLDVGVGIVSVKAKCNFDKDFASSSGFARRASEDVYNKKTDIGENFDDMVEKNDRAFTGSDLENYSTGKVLHITKIMNCNLSALQSAGVSVETHNNARLLQHLTPLMLKSTNSQQADLLHRIDLLKKDLAAVDEKLSDRLDSLDTAFAAHKLEFVDFSKTVTNDIKNLQTLIKGESDLREKGQLQIQSGTYNVEKFARGNLFGGGASVLVSNPIAFAQNKFREAPVVFVVWGRLDIGEIRSHTSKENNTIAHARLFTALSAINVTNDGFAITAGALDPTVITTNSTVSWVAIGR